MLHDRLTARSLAAAFLLAAPALVRADAVIDAPMARAIPHHEEWFGEVRTDDYFWLRNADDPEVIEYLKAENEYAEQVMEPTRALQDKLYEEFVTRITEDDQSVPERIDSFYYYARDIKGKEYPLYCRKKHTLEAPEQVILDLNAVAAEYGYCALGTLRLSPDHSLLAYTIDTSGAEYYTLYVKDLHADTLLADRITDTEYAVQWANDNRTLFYLRCDSTGRPEQLMRHRLGESADTLLYRENDPLYYMGLRRTRSDRFVLMVLESKITCEVHLIDADAPEQALRCFAPRVTGVEYYIDHHGSEFFIMTNLAARNFRLMRADTAATDPDRWIEVIPHRDSVLIEDVNVFARHLVLSERVLGLPRIRIFDLDAQTSHTVAFDEPTYSCWIEANPEYDTDTLRFAYASLTTPLATYDYSMSDGERVLRKQKVVNGYDAGRYESARLFAAAPDGTPIPISLVYLKGFPCDGTRPLLLEGYGAYGSSFDPWFSSNRLSLLDRGFAYAIAHVRGGGEMGRSWYEDGKLLNKRNTFTDFIACAEYLIDQGYTSRRNLAIEGGSAGGLLIGAVLNMRPDLFGAALADVPFVDALNTMLDPSIPLTVLEYDEWGNPRDRVYYDYIKTYAPYENVRRAPYPPILATAGLNDPRVGFWEPAKWVARLRAAKTDQNPLLLKTNMGAGHGGVSGRYGYLRETAFSYAFLLWTLGIRE